MKIYEVSGHDKGLSHFYEPSKDAANRRKREMKKEKLRQRRDPAVIDVLLLRGPESRKR